MSERGFIVVRRQRVGTVLDNAMGGDGEAIVFTEREAAEAWIPGMTCPRDWDVLEVEVVPLPASPETNEGTNR